MPPFYDRAAARLNLGAHTARSRSHRGMSAVYTSVSKRIDVLRWTVSYASRDSVIACADSRAMFTTVSMSGFRCFEDLRVTDLGRVNLVVGENGAGKTSLLEGMRLLRAGGNPMTLLASALSRGEYDSEENEDGSYERLAMLRFAFHGRQVREGMCFRIKGGGADEADRTITGEIIDVSGNDPDAPMLGSPSSDPGEIEWRGMFPEWAVRLRLDEGSASIDVPLHWSRGSAHRLRLMAPRWDARARAEIPVFLRANDVDDTVLGQLWDRVAATPDKDGVIAALQRLEPHIRDIDLRSEPRLPFRSRVAVRIENGASSSAPIGSFGEGVAWLFTLALGAAATPNKLLLVDDIDAGLHHRVMAPMWSMVIETARRRGLQVFATTHSIDCITALRRACIDAPEHAGEIRVVRLVKGGRSGITFTADELDTAIDGEIEVRG
jgi:AAA domain, putative AbiEii toxin, Type IV TA system/AAA domain